MLFVRLKNGSTWEVKPGCDIIFVEFQINKDYRIQFISNLSDRTINFSCSEVERIFNG